MTHQRLHAPSILVAAMSATGFLGGCGATGGSDGRATRTLEYSDFIALTPAGLAVETPAAGGGATPQEDSVPVSESSLPSSALEAPVNGAGAAALVESSPPPIAESVDEGDVRATQEDGSAPPSSGVTETRTPEDAEAWREEVAELSPGERVRIDSLVGEINGRPVYANEFFAPIDSRLRLAREQTRSELAFKEALSVIVAERLYQQVMSELLLAEALSQITPEQQVGLIAWLTQTRERFVSERGGGSVAVAEGELEAEGYTSIDEAVKDERDRTLLRMLLQQEVMPRVLVSWRDVQRRYERDFDKYNPPAQATLAWIHLTPGRDDAEIERVTQQLQTGIPFLEVAETAGMLQSGLMFDKPLTLGPGGLGESEDLIPLYRERLAGLSEGDTVGPFTQELSRGGEWRVWLHVVSISRQAGRPIYDPDVQMEIKDTLFQERFMTEQELYFRRLLDEAIEADLTEVQKRLIEFGEKRYSG